MKGEKGKPAGRACPLFMSAIKDGGLLPITLDKERHMLFSLHVIDEVEDRMGDDGDIGDLQKMMEGKGRMKFITWLLTLLINEGANYIQFRDTGQIEGAEVVTERIVAMLIHSSNVQNIMANIFNAFRLANKGTAEPPGEAEGDEEDDGTEGNATAGEGE